MAVNHATYMPIYDATFSALGVNQGSYSRTPEENHPSFAAFTERMTLIADGRAFPFCRDLGEAHGFLQMSGYFLEHTLSSVNTFQETKVLSGVQTGNAMAKIRRTENQREKSSIIASFVEDALKEALPFVNATFLLGDEFWAKCVFEIKKPEYNAISERCRLDIGVGSCSAESLEMYANTSMAFRENLHELFTMGGLDAGASQLVGTLRVDRTQAANLRTIFRSIISKRQKRLGGRAIGEGLGVLDRAALKRQKEDEHHVNYFVDFFMNNVAEPFIPRDRQNLSRKLLMTTAWMEYIRLRGSPEGGLQSVRGLTPEERVRIEDEMVAIQREGAIANAQQASNYTQQCANMDIIFNFFLQLRASGILATVINPATSFTVRKKLNIALYMIGRKLKNQEAVKTMLRVDPITARLIAIMNTTKSVHMPPYCLTPKRVYDMVAIYGTLCVGRWRQSFLHPGISTRYMVGYRSSSGTVMSILVNYWKLEQVAFEDTDNEDDISESEHVFHQILLQKANPYGSTVGRVFNMFDLRIIAENEE